MQQNIQTKALVTCGSNKSRNKSHSKDVALLYSVSSQTDCSDIFEQCNKTERLNFLYRGPVALSLGGFLFCRYD